MTKECEDYVPHGIKHPSRPQGHAHGLWRCQRGAHSPSTVLGTHQDAFSSSQNLVFLTPMETPNGGWNKLLFPQGEGYQELGPECSSKVVLYPALISLKLSHINISSCFFLNDAIQKLCIWNLKNKNKWCTHCLAFIYVFLLFTVKAGQLCTRKYHQVAHCADFLYSFGYNRL